jgi:hypothetical protein
MKRIHPFLAFVFIGLAALLATNQAQAGYVDNGNGTVTDQSTGLVWEKAGSATGMDWEAALARCQSATTGGHSDWRLPNIRELQSLVDLSRYNPALDPVFSDACSVGCTYWSGSTGAWDTNRAWYVPLDGDSSASTTYKYVTNHVRCVRGKP